MSERSNDSDSSTGDGASACAQFPGLLARRGCIRSIISMPPPAQRRSVIYQARVRRFGFDRAYRLGNKHHVICNRLYSEQTVLEE